MIGIQDLETLNQIKEEKLKARGYTAEVWQAFESKVAKVSQENADKYANRICALVLAGTQNGPNGEDETLAEIRKLILAGANLEYRFVESEKKNKGFTALILCARMGYYEAFRLLVQAGADINATTDYLTTAVIWSAREGNLNILEDLILLGADINMPCKDGDAALHSAVKHGKKESIKRLIEAGAILNPVNNKGETPLMIARTKKYDEIANMFADAMISELPPLPVVTSEDLAEELRLARERFKAL